MAVLKKEYELSIWNEKLDANGVKTEMKGPIIGANDMEYLGRATGVKLVKNAKGTSTLTFQMPTKFFDSKVGDFVKNEFIDELYSERKLKLHYKNKWYEFYIKKISEDKRHKAIMKSFTCEDSFIDELSRTGYDIEFSPDLNNSVEESGVFMEEILNGSVWDYTPEFNSGDFTEFNEERFYKIPLSQFGGSISGYPIDLEVLTTDLNKNSDYYKNKDFKTLDLEEEIEVKNINTNEKRTLQYGDDLARVKEIFWDPYYKDNGRDLLNDKNLVTLKSDYIYVPITDLSMIMGSIYNNAKKAIEEPALYGPFNRSYPEGRYGYALQPTSSNPTDLIQFICFEDKDEVLIDEVGVISDNRYHYVIKIEQWNKLLEEQFKKSGAGKADSGLIHWTSPTHENDKSFELTTKYQVEKNGNLLYTKNVVPSTRTIDDFQWYPVYYEEYLNNINEIEVAMARNISISDRTELNKNDDTYVTVYKQRDKDFLNLYSEEELNKLIKERIELEKKTDRTEEENNRLKEIQEEFRICSKLATRMILPSLAKNIVDNGSKITDTIGWEAKIQNNNLENGLETGSFYKLLEIKTQSTVKKTDSQTDFTLDETTVDGSTEDEGVCDFYLEILSPYIEKSDDLSLEGQIETDYALNFGFIGQEKKIEKDKVYAIRLQTGGWVTDYYTFYYRSNGSLDTNSTAGAPFKRTPREEVKYEKSIRDFKNWLQALYSNDISSLKLEDGAAARLKKIRDTLMKIYLPKTSDSKQIEKLNYIDPSLLALIKGGTVTISGDGDNYKNQEITIAAEDSLIGIHDSLVSEKYEMWSNLLILPTPDSSTTSTVINYNDTDVKYLKACWLAAKDDYSEYNNYTPSNFLSYITLSEVEINSWISSCISAAQHFEKANNVDLDKVLIGSGSINLQGNYIVEGIDTNEGNFISFSDLAEIQSSNLVFIPEKLEDLDNKNYLRAPLFYHKNFGADKEKRWTWEDKVPSDNYVEDNAFLLFKAKKTIENPYIAIRIDSQPAAVNFNSINKSYYRRGNNSGVEIQVILPDNTTGTINLTDLAKEQYCFVDNVLIELALINGKDVSSDVSQKFNADFLKSIGFNDDNWTVDIDAEKSGNREWGELRTGDFNDRASWSSYTDAENPIIYPSVGTATENATKSYAYALFVNKIYYGIFWMEYKKK